jgi:hypothetical protein
VIPCPGCGGNDLDVRTKGNVYDSRFLARVECLNCRETGPWSVPRWALSVAQDEALKLWERKHGEEGFSAQALP